MFIVEIISIPATPWHWSWDILLLKNVSWNTSLNLLRPLIPELHSILCNPLLTPLFCSVSIDSPKRWFLLHYASMVVSIAGVVTLLLARGHYSIDVIIAYWITTRIWWIFHTISNNENLKEIGSFGENQNNYLKKVTMASTKRNILNIRIEIFLFLLSL